MFAATAGANGDDTITGTSADILNVAAFEIVGALVSGAGTYTQANGQVVVLGGQAAGAADTSAASITALNAAGIVTAGAAAVVNWVVISDTNSTTLWAVTATATSSEYTNSTFTQVGTFNQAFTTAQLLTGTVAI